MPITLRFKEINKKASIGKQRVELVINSAGKQTVVILKPSFFLLNPFFVMYHASQQLQPDPPGNVQAQGNEQE